MITANDYNVWRAALGSASQAADGNGNGIVDAADYVIWRNGMMAVGRRGVVGS